MSLTTQYIIIHPHTCISCWKCVDECPRDVIGKVNFLGHSHSHIDYAENCVGCKKCIKVCTTQSIKETSIETTRFHRRVPHRRYPKWERMFVDLIQ